MEFSAGREVKFGNLARRVADQEEEVDGIGARDLCRLDVVKGRWLGAVFGTSLEDGLESRRVLQLLVGVWILAGLKRGDGVVGTELGSHLGEDCDRRSAWNGGGREEDGGALQLSVVFIRPMLTSRQTMAMPLAASRSLSSLSRRTLLVLLLLDMVSM